MFQITRSFLKTASFFALSCCCVFQAFIIYMGLSEQYKSVPIKNNDEFGGVNHTSVTEEYVMIGSFLTNKSDNMRQSNVPLSDVNDKPIVWQNAVIKNKNISDVESKSYGNNILTNERDKHQKPKNASISSEDEKLLENPIYKRFQIEAPKQKKRVNIVVIVQSAPSAIDRRQAVRATWLMDCVKTEKIVPACFFITDLLNETTPEYKALEKESSLYGDLKYQNVASGVQFGMRLLFQMVYAALNYDFDYFLRIDDDYFLCINRLFEELPYPRASRFVWAWVHCIDNVTRPDEGLLLFSKDIVQEFINQNPEEIRCTAYGGQNVGIWAQDLNFTNVFRHDERLHHSPTVQKEPSLRYMKNICQTYMGVHGCYGDDMEVLWNHRGANPTVVGDLISNSVVCEKSHILNWELFLGNYRREPKRCITNPIYTGGHSGRRTKYDSTACLSFLSTLFEAVPSCLVEL